MGRQEQAILRCRTRWPGQREERVQGGYLSVE